MLASGHRPAGRRARSRRSTCASIPGEIRAGNPTGFIWAGIVLVMALPIGRVVVSGAGFYAAGARRLALVSALVVLVVTLSIVAAPQIAA